MHWTITDSPQYQIILSTTKMIQISRQKAVDSFLKAAVPVCLNPYTSLAKYYQQEIKIGNWIALFLRCHKPTKNHFSHCREVRNKQLLDWNFHLLITILSQIGMRDGNKRESLRFHPRVLLNMTSFLLLTPYVLYSCIFQQISIKWSPQFSQRYKFCPSISSEIKDMPRPMIKYLTKKPESDNPLQPR